MSYPVKLLHQHLDKGAATTIPFRPLAAGLVHAILIGHADPVQKDGSPDPLPQIINLLIELFSPGATTAVARASRLVNIRPGVLNRVIFTVDTPATVGQLNGDWMAKVTNQNSDLGATFDLTIRYQVVSGNLGKIDHVCVVMLENRSFDHMLGYLKADHVVPDVNGLAGTEFNTDSHSNKITVFPLATPVFNADPGHGWIDVAGTRPDGVTPKDASAVQLHADPDAVPPLPSNAGFVRNFEAQLTVEAPDPPHDQIALGPSQSRKIAFIPIGGGRGPDGKTKNGIVGIRSVPLPPPTSGSGNLGQISISNPAGVVKTSSLSPIGAGALTAQITITGPEVDAGGLWTCEVTNLSPETLNFVTDFAGARSPVSPAAFETPASIMGYHTAKTVGVYDFLARNYIVCDHWFSSIPTDTFPNRLYAMTGGSGGIIDTPSNSTVTSNPPRFDLKTIFEFLQERGVEWNIYSSDVPFALVFTALARDAQYTSRMRDIAELETAALTGDLPALAWIDPNFNDFPDGVHNASDDHPPGDVSRGQAFVKRVYNALVNSPAWSKTMLIITYDEHGGFYDHVLPPGTPHGPKGPADDNPNLRRYGPRIPVMIVSPWVDKGKVSHVVHDNTSILHSVLRRFCQPSVPSMGARTDNAHDLGYILNQSAPRSPIQVSWSGSDAKLVGPPLSGIGSTIRLGVLGI